jgi:putative peptide zinc metalloprotease protein
LGLVATNDGSSPELTTVDPLLALKFRVAVVNPDQVKRVTSVFRPLFLAPVIALVLACLVAVDVWLFGYHGVGGGLRSALYHPALLLLLLGLVIVGAGFHEFGHAVACTYGGATPGVMGAGIYIAWPAFYTDVTDAYRLDRKGRLRTDLGGVYFNTVFIVMTAAVYFATGWEFLLLVIVIQHLEIFHQLLPFIRLDGYYIVTDLTGVPDLFTRIKPILASLNPWRDSDSRVTDLKRWARVVATLWVVLVIPVLLVNLAMMAYAFPRIAATAWDSGGQQLQQLDRGPLEAVLAVVQVAVLAIPVIGIALTFWLLARRLGIGLWHRTEHRPIARAAVLALGVAGATLVVLAIWPRGEYEPIRRNERGTIGELATAVRRTVEGKATSIPPETPADSQAPNAPSAPVTSAPGPTPTSLPANSPPATSSPSPTAPPTTAPATTTTVPTEPPTTTPPTTAPPTTTTPP